MDRIEADRTENPLLRGPLGEGWVVRRATLYALLAWLVPGLVLLFRYYSELESVQVLEELRSWHVVELQADLVERSLDRMCVDVRLLAEQADLRVGGNGPGDPDRPDQVDRLAREYETFLRAVGDYDRLRLLTPEGQELIRVEGGNGSVRIAPADELRDCRSLTGFRVAGSLTGAEVRFTPLDVDEAGSVVQVATVLMDGSGSRRFVLLLRRCGRELRSRLAALAQQHPGRTLLLDAEGFSLHETDRGETRVLPATDSERRFERTEPAAWMRIEQGDRGQFVSGRGLFTFTTVVPERAGGGILKVVSFVPTAEIQGPVNAAYRRHVWAALAAIFLVFVLSYHVANGQALRAAHRKRQADSERRLRALSTELLLAQERERGRIARDLHDEVGQIGTAAHLHLQRAADVQSPEKKDELIARADEAVQGLLRWAHDMASRLRPAALDDLGLKEAVLLLVAQFEQAAGIRVQVELSAGKPALPPRVSEQAYRIIQESLTNVLKHARARGVELSVKQTDGQLLLELKDDGVGFDTVEEPASGFGIQGMRERVELLGGRFELRSVPGQSTVVRVILPIDLEENPD